MPRRSERRQNRFCKAFGDASSHEAGASHLALAPARFVSRQVIFCARRRSPCANKRPPPAFCLAHLLKPAAELPRRPPRRCRARPLGRFWIAALFPATNAHLAYWLARAGAAAVTPTHIVTGQRIPRPSSGRAAPGRAASASRPARSTPRANASIADQNIVKHERAAGRVGRGAAQRDGVAPRRGARVDRRAVRLRRRVLTAASRRRGCALPTASRSADSSSSTRRAQPACPALRVTAST